MPWRRLPTPTASSSILKITLILNILKYLAPNAPRCYSNHKESRDEIRNQLGLVTLALDSTVIHVQDAVIEFLRFGLGMHDAWCWRELEALWKRDVVDSIFVLVSTKWTGQIKIEDSDINLGLDQPANGPYPHSMCH